MVKRTLVLALVFIFSLVTVSYAADLPFRWGMTKKEVENYEEREMKSKWVFSNSSRANANISDKEALFIRETELAYHRKVLIGRGMISYFFGDSNRLEAVSIGWNVYNADYPKIKEYILDYIDSLGVRPISVPSAPAPGGLIDDPGTSNIVYEFAMKDTGDFVVADFRPISRGYRMWIHFMDRKSRTTYFWPWGSYRPE